MKKNKHKLNSKDIQNAFENKLEQSRIDDLDEFALEALKGTQYLDTEQALDAISKNALKRFKQTNFKRKKAHSLSVIMKAAAIIGVLFLFSLLIPKQPNTHIAALTKDVPCAHPMCDTRNLDISEQPAQKKQLKKAFDAFQNKKYKEASSLFSLYLNKNKTDESIIFYNGISLMKSDQPEEAIHAFESLISPIQRVFNAQLAYTKWYLSLCYLDTEQTNKALPLLVSLEENDNQFNSKAKQLLLDLHYYKG